ncbi:MAG TPA: DNA/RNA non-specific endonuclease [Kofleriaceae bacterium]
MRCYLALPLLVACSTSSAVPETDAMPPDVTSSDVPSDPLDSPHLALGIATDDTPADDLLLVHDQYVVSYNPILNEANWVSWRTRPQDFGPAPRFAGAFAEDTMLPTGMYRVDTSAYDGPGYDRGHMLRSEERTDTEAHNIETFVMTNVVPQTADLNRGVWFDFEQYVQYQVEGTQPKDAYVIAGPVFPAACRTHQPRAAGDGCPDMGHDTDPEHRIALPTATFKIVAFMPAGAPFDAATATVAAVLMPNIDGVKYDHWYEYKSTVAEIEAATGYDIPAL